jgi:predicted nucleotide-binding protein (sugar kinase/HSP70/actin superfamily)
MWQILRKVVEISCALAESEDVEEKKEKVKTLALEIWERIDPTPDIELDDWVVEAIIDHLIDWVVDDMIEYSESLSLS